MRDLLRVPADFGKPHTLRGVPVLLRFIFRKTVWYPYSPGSWLTSFTARRFIFPIEYSCVLYSPTRFRVASSARRLHDAIPAQPLETFAKYGLQCCLQRDTARVRIGKRRAVHLVAKKHAAPKQHGEHEVWRNLGKWVLQVIVNLLL